MLFYGQLDEDGKWDGDCIINIYENKKLKLITEAVYNNGELSTFQQAFPNESARQNGQNVWFFSNRAMKEGFSIGETWDYIREGDFKQTFSYDKVTADDILTIQELQSEVAVQLEGYYRGNTSGGRFNDDSGEAYMVKYFEDGTVRTLYKGKFKNGFPEDSSNDGWMIGRSSMEDSYSHYVGPFKEGHPTISPHAPNAKDYWEIGISQDRIVELLDDKTFSYLLVGRTQCAMARPREISLAYRIQQMLLYGCIQGFD